MSDHDGNSLKRRLNWEKSLDSFTGLPLSWIRGGEKIRFIRLPALLKAASERYNFLHGKKNLFDFTVTALGFTFIRAGGFLCA